VVTRAVSIYAKTDTSWVGGAALYTSTDNVTWTRQGSAMGTSCVIKYGPVNIASGTTIYYQIADNAVNPGSGGTTYEHRSNTTTSCPTSPSTVCVGSFTVGAIAVNIAINAQEVACP
jgi:hypothetical protein